MIFEAVVCKGDKNEKHKAIGCIRFLNFAILLLCYFYRRRTRGLVLGFHLNEVKISSLLCNDFIKPTEKERTFRFFRFVLSFCLYMGLGLAHKHSTGQMHLVALCVAFCNTFFGRCHLPNGRFLTRSFPRFCQRAN